MTTRRPAIAGLFYPARAEDVEAELARLLPEVATPTRARAVVVPHAGWMYSGRVAGEVYARVDVPRLVVGLGPNHTGRGAGGAVMAAGCWAIPGAEIPVADELARAILQRCAALEEDDEAHRQEHALEVQLPFLHRRRPDIAFVPIALGRLDLEVCLDVGRALAAAITELGEPVLVVCSSDLNHYEAHAESTRKDRLAIEALLGLDPAALHGVVEAERISMCGVAPAVATLAALGALGCRQATLVRYATSGDISGDYKRVVGYAGLIFV